MKGMQRISRGSGFSGAARYIFANLNATFLCASNVLVARDAKGVALEMSSAARAFRPDIKRPVWHQSLRLPKGEKVSPRKFGDVVKDYMQRMGWDPDRHQWFAVLSDDPAGQHVHIGGNRVALDGTVYLGQNENLISTRVTQELELIHGLRLTKGPGFVLVPGLGRPTARVAGPKDRKVKKKEGERYARLEEQSGTPTLPPRRRLQRVLKQARTAGRVGGLRAFLASAEAAGVRVLANVSETGKVNGLSFNVDTVSFKASQAGTDYSWATLSKELQYDHERDAVHLRARCLRFVDPAELPLIGDWLKLVRPSTSERVRSGLHESDKPDARRPPPEERDGRDSAAASVDFPQTTSPQATPPVPVERDSGAAAAGGRVLTATLAPSSSEQKHPARPSEARLAAVPDSPSIVGEREAWVAFSQQRSSANSYEPRMGRWGVLYIRQPGDVYALIDTGRRIKLAHVDEDSIRAALVLAGEKWRVFTLEGSDEFKQLAVVQAVRLGLASKIGNPELRAVIATETLRRSSAGRRVERVATEKVSKSGAGEGGPHRSPDALGARLPPSRQRRPS